MKNPFQTGKLLQVLMRAHPKSDPFRDTFQEKASFFLKQQFCPEDSLAVSVVRGQLGKLCPQGVFFSGVWRKNKHCQTLKMFLYTLK